jgi:hypothetical protein
MTADFALFTVLFTLGVLVGFYLGMKFWDQFNK